VHGRGDCDEVICHTTLSARDLSSAGRCGVRHVVCCIKVADVGGGERIHESSGGGLGLSMAIHTRSPLNSTLKNISYHLQFYINDFSFYSIVFCTREPLNATSISNYSLVYIIPYN
jgi:hypothetical protein